MHGKLAEPNLTQRPLVFFMPSAEGDAPNYVRFRAALEDSMDFKVIDYPGWRALIDGGAGFDVIVDAAVAQMLAEPGCTTYFLAGYSFGGFVAWETACRLIELGRSVGFVGLIDTRRQEATRAPETRAQRLGRKLRYVRERPRSVLEAIRWQFAYRVAMKVCPRLLLREVGDMALRTRFTSGFGSRLLVRTRLAAMNKIDSKPQQAPTYLFRSDEFAPGAQDFNWGRLCGQLQVVPVTGSHLTLFQSPNFESLTSAFRAAVLAAQSELVRR
jgi:thioesterase domain-containing protein